MIIERVDETESVFFLLSVSMCYLHLDTRALEEFGKSPSVLHWNYSTLHNLTWENIRRNRVGVCNEGARSLN